MSNVQMDRARVERALQDCGIELLGTREAMCVVRIGWATIALHPEALSWERIKELERFRIDPRHLAQGGMYSVSPHVGRHIGFQLGPIQDAIMAGCRERGEAPPGRVYVWLWD
jgi:hypothetical protein